MVVKKAFLTNDHAVRVSSLDYFLIHFIHYGDCITLLLIGRLKFNITIITS